MDEIKRKTHAKGEGSTNRAILLGLLMISYSTWKGGPSSSSSSLISSIVILDVNLKKIESWGFMADGVCSKSTKTQKSWSRSKI